MEAQMEWSYFNLARLVKKKSHFLFLGMTYQEKYGVHKLKGRRGKCIFCSMFLSSH